MRGRKSQLFVIEVLIAVGVLLVLLSTLFASQNFSDPINDDVTSDQVLLEKAISSVRTSGALYEYFDAARQEFLNGGDLPSTNQTEITLIQGISAALPSNFRFSVRLYSDLSSNGTFTLIDLANQEVPRTGAEQLIIYEYYSSSHYSEIFGPVYHKYRLQVIAWKI